MFWIGAAVLCGGIIFVVVKAYLGIVHRWEEDDGDL